MKKLLTTILAIVYLTSSCGASVNLHYCMGKLMSWDMSAKNKSKCGSCGMEKAGQKSCCHDEQKQLKVEKDQTVYESASQFASLPFVTITASHTTLPLINVSNIVVNNPSTHSPPLSGNVPIFIFNRNFRI